jgi:hypothetical protein
VNLLLDDAHGLVLGGDQHLVGDAGSLEFQTCLSWNKSAVLLQTFREFLKVLLQLLSVRVGTKVLRWVQICWKIGFVIGDIN